MSSAPAMPLFLDAYLADTTHLSTEEHGAYLLLLMAMWRRDGSVPNDDRDVARIVGMELAKWRKTKKRLLPFLTIDGGMVSQKRLSKEWEYVRKKREKNSANGSKGGRPKANINNRLDQANGSVSDNPDESTQNPEPIPKEKANAFSKRAGAQKPNGFVVVRKTTDAIEDFIEELGDDERRIGIGSEGHGSDVPMLSAVRAR